MKKVLTIAIAVLLIAVSVMPAFAANVDSPDATKANYVVHIIGDDEGGHVVKEYKTDVDEDGKQTVVITGIPDEGYEFTGWVIDGDFVPQGDLTDAELELIISSDIDVKPIFKKTSTDNTSDTTDTKVVPTEKKVIDDGSKSPQTGSSDGTVVAILIVSVLALGAVLIVAKRRSTDK